MHNNGQTWAMWLFLALGGASILWGLAAAGIPRLVGILLHALLEHPAIAAIVVKNRERIIKILEASEKAAEAEIAAAQAPATPEPPSASSSDAPPAK